VRRNELAKIKHTRDKPAAVHVKLAESITQRFGGRGEEVILDIAQHAAPSKTGFSKAATRVANSLHPKINKIPQLDDENNSKFKLTVGDEVRQNREEKYVLWNDENNCMELDAKLKLSGRREAPVKDRSGDIKIANHRAKLLENLQLNAAVSRSDEIWKRLYHLGKAAGNN
jgi:hypothetical protein